jgi:hypothetical protein
MIVGDRRRSSAAAAGLGVEEVSGIGFSSESVKDEERKRG